MTEQTSSQYSDEDRIIRTSLDHLFLHYFSHDPAAELSTISKYFDYITRRIDYDEVSVNVPSDLLGSFEPICLLLSDHLSFYPETVQTQVSEIIKDGKLSQTFSVLAALSEQHRRRIVNRSRSFVLMIMGVFTTRLNPSEPEFTSESLFNTKLAVSRLSRILLYASSIQLLDFDTGAEKLKDHYDPTLIEKTKLLALIRVLRMQLDSVPDDNVRTRLIEHVENLEKEVQKARPRWGRVIAGFFILFSFIADVKAISPGSYDAVFSTVKEIIQVLHQEGSVQHHRGHQLFLPEHDTSATLPTRTREEESDEQSDDKR